LTLLAHTPYTIPIVNQLMTTKKPVTVVSWKIAQLERETADGFVFTAHYTVDANDGTYSAGAYGSVGFQRPDNLIPFSELTEQQIIEWTQEALGGDEKVIEIEDALQNQLDEQRAPSKAAGLPWS
jgi:hypothetical protein